MKKEITYEELQAAASYVRARLPYTPRVALVLGSGLGDFADRLTIDAKISYGEIPHFPVSTVAGHDGCFLLGKVEACPVIIMKGRVHYYEGYSMQEVVMPVRVMRMLGAETLILTNAAGGINSSYKPGTLVRITDQIGSFVPSTLIGANIEAFGTRFPDMSHVYDAELGDRLDAVAKMQGIELEEGIYLQTTGPNYETPAEIRMFRTLGADLVGMSTACEAMTARHAGMRIVGVSCVTNMAAGMSTGELNHKEVQETADKIAEDFQTLIYKFIAEIG
mgnify:FL=1